MTDPSEIVRTFFSRWLSAHLILPTGWVGRPYDDRFALESVSAEPGWLTIALDTGHTLVVSGDATVRDVGGSLLIARFDAATFGGGGRVARTYREGVVEFVGIGAERADQAIRDEG